MPRGRRVKVTIYLPDDLGRRVQAARLPVSRIAQAALRAALDDPDEPTLIALELERLAARLTGTHT